MWPSLSPFWSVKAYVSINTQHWENHIFQTGRGYLVALIGNHPPVSLPTLHLEIVMFAHESPDLLWWHWSPARLSVFNTDFARWCCCVVVKRLNKSSNDSFWPPVSSFCAALGARLDKKCWETSFKIWLMIKGNTIHRVWPQIRSKSSFSSTFKA